MAFGKPKLKPVYCTVTSIVCMFTHRTVFHQCAFAKISNWSNLRAIYSYIPSKSSCFNQTFYRVQQLYQSCKQTAETIFRKGILLHL